MKRYLFIGPSLPDAATILAGTGVAVLPPIAAGDLLRLSPVEGDVVGIVDGYFHQTRAVRHKEILALLDTGVQVLGAASIGALRAAELDVFGMRGLGTIYRDYRDGRLVADDEVALLHAPADEAYQSLSEPLVNIRATLALAVREDVVDAGTADQLIAILGQRPYRLRSYPELVRLAEESGLPDDRVEALRRLCSRRAVNVKRADALCLVDAVRSPEPAGAVRSARPSFDLARTIFLEQWTIAARRGSATTEPIAALSVLRICQLFARDYPRFYRDLVFGYLSGECRRLCGQPLPPDPAEAAVAHGVHRGLFPPPTHGDPRDFAFIDGWLTPAERASLERPARLATYVVRSFQLELGFPADALVLDALDRVAGETAAGLVRAAESVNQQAKQASADFDIHALSREQILAFLTVHFGVARDELEYSALDRGMKSLDILVAATRPCYLLAKYNPTVTAFRLA